MNCRRVERLLSDSLDGPLPASAARAVSDHLAGCAACRRRRETLGRLAADLRAGLPRPEPAWGLARRAVAAWEFEQNSVPRNTRRAAKTWQPQRAWLVVPAATAVAAITATLAGHVPFGPPRTPAVPLSIDRGSSAATAGSGHESAPVTALSSPTPRSAENPKITGGPRVSSATAAAALPLPLPRLRTSHRALHPETPDEVATGLAFPAPPPQATVAAMPPRPVPVQDDLAYLNGTNDSAFVLAGWTHLYADDTAGLQQRVDRIVRTGDDFVSVPFPRVAALNNASVVAAAVAAYRQEKDVVDARLAQNVTLSEKASAFSDLCQHLTQTTGVTFTAARSVADDKATIFCDDVPLRDVLRQITRVFGFRWARRGEPGAYTYELGQDLRGQLAEEELRNQDKNAALLALEDEMAARRNDRTGTALAATRVYEQLSPQELATLRSGGELRFNSYAKDPGSEVAQNFGRFGLPDDIARPILEGSGGVVLASGEKFVPALAAVELRLNRSELGQVALEAETMVFALQPDGSPSYGYGRPHTLATGRSPSVARPGNAEGNKTLQNDPILARTVVLAPKPSCSRFARDSRAAVREQAAPAPPQPDPDHLARYERAQRGVWDGAPHVTTADVWEEVHAKTGLPIVADSYSRLYPQGSVTLACTTVFDVLCRLGDTLGVRWKKDGDFLECRSTSFFWDRLKEVPNRYLVRWQEASRKNKGLPFADLLDMAASLSDSQLDSITVGDAVVHCGELPEWDTLQKRMGYYSARSFARLLANVSPATRRAFMQPDGVAFARLAPAEQQELLSLMTTHLRHFLPKLEDLPQTRFRVEYAPAGWYAWSKRVEDRFRVPLVSGRTSEEALAAARKRDPTVTPAQIEQSGGVLAVTKFSPGGDADVIAGLRPDTLTTVPALNKK